MEGAEAHQNTFAAGNESRPWLCQTGSGLEDDFPVKERRKSAKEKPNKFSQLIGFHFLKKKIQAWKKKRQVAQHHVDSSAMNDSSWWEELKEDEEIEANSEDKLKRYMAEMKLQDKPEKPPVARINENHTEASLYPQAAVITNRITPVTYYPPGVEVIDQYILKQTIGTGSFSQVKLANHSLTNDPVAIKMIDRGALNESSRLRMTVMREVELMRVICY